MNNKIQLMPISDLLEKKFFIPSYQRGYRWTKQQIDDLLDDIYTFASKKNKSEKEFYCLQPIIVKAIKDNADNIIQYEVIDGQQRLTTISILFSFLLKEFLLGKPLKKRYGKDLYTLSYETRPELTQFLNNIDKNDASDIDVYHIAQAYNYIELWFEKKIESEGLMFDDICDSILRTLVYSQENQKEEGIVQVIWYELKGENSNPIDTFIRVNLGKISLTNAELIKALFLQKRNFGEGNAATLKQLEIAQEWDRMENELQDENFWWFLNKDSNNSSSHIEFIFDMIRKVAIEKEPDLATIIGNDNFKTFRYFNYLFGQNTDYSVIKLNWDKVRSLFDTFLEWYQNPYWYHYIGFLIYSGRSVREIFELLSHESIKTKEEATNKLIIEIKKEFTKVHWAELNHEFHLDISYHSDKELLRKFYLLFNLEYIIRKSDHQSLIYKFPFKSFKMKNNSETSWDIEHINSATENSLEKEADRIVWLENVLKDDIKLPEELKNRVLSYISEEGKNGFENIQDEILEITGDQKINAELNDSIGNLTLLDSGTNRGYGNALYSSKRRIIINKDKNGTFIPICTKNVFLKYFDGNPQSTWTESDVLAYRNVLENMMSKFLAKKPKVAEYETV